MGFEEERNDISIHNRERCGVHQRLIGREPSLRSARIKATNSSAPSGSYSVSVFRSTRLTGGLRITPAGTRARLPFASVPCAFCGILIPILTQLGIVIRFRTRRAFSLN